jgi:hypothetical protein
MWYLISFIIIFIIFTILYTNIEAFTATDYVAPDAEVKISKKVNGRGVFANKAYKIGDTIEVCPTIIDKSSNFQGVIKDYLFQYDKENSVVAFGFCPLYNHSDDYNALWKVLSKDQMKVYATKDINIGDEIFVSYGDAYWNTRKLVKK